MTNKPERTCIACRSKGSKENFVKVVKNKAGEFAIERDKKLDGRGAYICNTKECAEKCAKTRALNRVFKMVVPQEVYEELKNEFTNTEN